MVLSFGFRIVRYLKCIRCFNAKLREELLPPIHCNVSRFRAFTEEPAHSDDMVFLSCGLLF